MNFITLGAAIIADLIAVSKTPEGQKLIKDISALIALLASNAKADNLHKQPEENREVSAIEAAIKAEVERDF